MSATMQTIVAKPAPPPRVMIAWAMKMFRIIVMIKMIVFFISVVSLMLLFVINGGEFP